MAKREVTVLVCDLCEASTASVQTRSFGLDGKTFEVEACARDWKTIEKALAPFVEAGRKIRKRQSPRGAQPR